MIDKDLMKKLNDDHIEIRISSHADRLRDEADADYISARMAYRAQCGGQFLWSSLQCVEKYLKCILLHNRIPSLSLGHNIGKAISLVRTRTPCKIKFIEPKCEAFIKYINDVGQHRYGDAAQRADCDDLEILDSVVWSIRRYCQAFHLPVAANLSDDSMRYFKKGFYRNIDEASKNPPD